MLDVNTVINVTNRSYGSVGYEVADLGIHRTYEPGETKEVSFNEILKLSYSTGGKRLIEKYLIIDNPQAVREILGEVEPEYFYTEEDVKTLLLTGSLAQLQDCLDFANKGVIDLVKKLAVDLEINDVSKREEIKKKTGYDVNNAILIKHQVMEADEAPVEKSARRAAPIKSVEESAAAAPARRAEPPKYKVVK